MIKTYIIITERGEYYCGKTLDIERRMKQHKTEKEPLSIIEDSLS